MRARFEPVDIAILAAYMVFTLAVGFWKRRQTTEQFLIGDRALGLPVFVATLVATWYGGILGVGEFTYRYGLVNWTTQGLPYYLFAIIFGLVLAARVRKAAHYTIPDKLNEAYGRPAALVGSVFTFFMATPAPYILMVGQLITVATGMPLVWAVLAGTALSASYVYVGGFQSDVRINIYQFCLMFLGFGLALPVLMARTGDLPWLSRTLPPGHLSLDGGLGAGYIAVWFFIALWTLIDPGFHQRCYAARSPGVAKWGVLAAVGCWLLFDTLTTTTGLYARAAMPDLGDKSAGLAFPMLAQRLLPGGVRGLFYVAMLATVMSTVVSYTFLGAMTVGRDMIWRARGETSTEKVPGYARLGFIATCGVAIAISLWLPSVVRQWWAIGTVFVPGMSYALLTAYWRIDALPPRWAVASMLCGSLTSAACLATGWAAKGAGADVTDSSIFPLGVQPMYPGLVAGALPWALGLATARLRRRATPAA
jgi:SSS family solute:Na+ symporter